MKTSSETQWHHRLIFVACLLISLAIGIWTGEVAVALLGALGVGFIGMATTRYTTGEW